MHKIIRLFLLSLLFTVAAQAQVQKVKLNSITVDGNITADASMVRLNSGLVAGSEVSGEDIQQAVRNLWSLNIFADIQIYVTNQSYEGLDLLIKVQEYPRLREVTIEGFDEFSKDDVEEELDTYRSMVVTPFRIARMKKNLLKKYHEEGYLLADVAIDTATSGKNYVNLNVIIVEGKEVQIEKIRIHGYTELDPEDLVDAMEETQEDRWWRSADFDPKKYEEDKQKVVLFMKENGYRDAEILRDSLSYNEDHTDLYLDIWVHEGNKYYFGNISFEGNVIFDEEILLANLDIEKGDLYDQKKYDEGIRDRLQKLYYNQGYLFANIKPTETPLENEDRKSVV